MLHSEATLIRLHESYAVSAYQFAWSITKDESLAQDVVQEFFLRVAKDDEAILTARSERAVVFTIIRHLALDALRRRSRREKALQNFASETQQWFEASEDAEFAETQRMLTEVLAELPEEQRSVIHLHLWQQLSFREIGELLQTATQTVASRYRYGLEKLRAAFTETKRPMP